MNAQANAPIIIKRKKIIKGGGHHGGAWKVAYADFVTAMMAFFMLMWLLNATTEQQRKGLADYFAPSIPLSRVSGGGVGMFGGNDVMTRDTLPESGEGPAAPSSETVVAVPTAELAASAAAEVEALNELEQMLTGAGGEALISDMALRHVVTRLTDEGLVIEIFALPDAPIFEGDATEPTRMLRELVEMIARVSSVITNPVAVAGHVSARPIVLAENPVWDISGARAAAVRQILEQGGLDPARIRRLTGFGDRSPATEYPLEVRNDRVEITLLRTMR